MRRLRLTCLVVGAVTLASCGSSARSSDDAESLEHAMRVAEDGRITSEADLERLIDGLEHPSERIQRQAVRAIGRLERPGLHFLIQPLMRAPSPDVRAEAVTAFAQAALGIARPQAGTQQPVDVATFSEALLGRLDVEEHPDVVGVMCEALGHLPYRSAAQVSEVEAAIVETAAAPPEVGAASVVLGAAKGLESLLRLQAPLSEPSERTVTLLRSWVGNPVRDDGRDPARLDGFMADAAPRIRRLAFAALGVSRRLDRQSLEAALADEDPQVRRLGVVGLGSPDVDDVDDVDELLDRAGHDADAIVRVAAVRVHGSRGGPDACAALLRATDDESTHVALEAIDRLSACGREATPRLIALVTALPGADQPDGVWQRPAHAVAALARVAPDAAREHLEAFVSHPAWGVRAYSARAAAALGDRTTLEGLARDPDANVRQAGLRGLIDVAGHEADELYLEALGSDDYQVVRLAALALDGTERTDVVPALLSALDRLTAQRRDTSRDPRVAIIDRLAQLGSAEHADRLRPYVRDFDLQVAGRVASILRNWTGAVEQPAPTPLAAPAVPDPAELSDLANARARLTMARGGTFEFRLLVDEAPVTVARFARLARDGYYDGLTFHRVVPNFVIQGGSPGANEFMGDGPFLRDELGMRPHVRGAVGISTRGRDTGDAQFFIDLIDNPRLDHNYTVLGQVVSGMAVVDAVLEGDIIERVEILR